MVSFAFAFAHAMFVRSFPITEAIKSGGLALAWRLLSLQALLQVVFLAGLASLGKQESILFVLAAGIAALLFSAALYFGRVFDLWRLFIPFSDQGTPAEGLALVFSLSVTWILVRKAFPAIASGGQ